MTSRIRTAAIGTSLALAGLAVATPSYAGLEPGACDGVEGCEVVAHADVDGDGARDEVALASTSEENTVEVRVLTAAGELATATRSTFVESGDVWQGRARFDDRKGRELVLTEHYQTGDRFYHVLTWRKGGLVTLEAPEGSETWQITGNGRAVRGWQRTKKMPVGTVKERFATPADDTGETYDGTRTTYRWKKGTWKQVATSTTTISAERASTKWYGFSIDKLPRT